MSDHTYEDAAHLLRRGGFGAAPDAIRAAVAKGVAAVTDDLLHPENTPDTLDDDAILTRLSDLLPENRKVNKNGREYLPLQVVKMWWTHRMIATPHPLVEKMTLFWHGHFTSKLGGMQGEQMLHQNQLFRKYALGNFRALTLAVSRDPAMLIYLNGNQNYKAHANENYGRELMELYTCGIGNYTENDVKAASRAFTGWNLRGSQFYFNERQHDDTPKTFLGKTGDWNGNDIVDMLVAHPATARRLCTQLFTHFAYPDPEPAVLDALIKTYYSSGYNIRALLAQILRSQAFYSDKARYAVIKSPAQFVVGSVKMFGLESAVNILPADITPENDMTNTTTGQSGLVNPQQRRAGLKLGMLATLPIAMRSMGQDLFEPPSVKGWDGGEEWINSSTMMARLNFAGRLAQARQAFDGQFVQAAAYVQQHNLPDAAAWVDYLASTLGPLHLTPAVRKTLIDYVNGAGENAAPAAQNPTVQNTAFAGVPRQRRLRAQRQAGPGGLEGRLRGVIPLIMSTAEYQVC